MNLDRLTKDQLLELTWRLDKKSSWMLGFIFNCRMFNMRMRAQKAYDKKPNEYVFGRKIGEKND